MSKSKHLSSLQRSILAVIGETTEGQPSLHVIPGFRNQCLQRLYVAELIHDDESTGWNMRLTDAGRAALVAK